MPRKKGESSGQPREPPRWLPENRRRYSTRSGGWRPVPQGTPTFYDLDPPSPPPEVAAAEPQSAEPQTAETGSENPVPLDIAEPIHQRRTRAASRRIRATAIQKPDVSEPVASFVEPEVAAAGPQSAEIESVEPEVAEPQSADTEYPESSRPRRRKGKEPMEFSEHDTVKASSGRRHTRAMSRQGIPVEPTPPPQPQYEPAQTETTDADLDFIRGYQTPHGIRFGDLEQIARYEIISFRPVLASTFCDEYTLRSLGLFEEIARIVDLMGWRRIAFGDWFVFEDLTYEFFSSFVEDDGVIKFRMDGVLYVWNLSEFRAALGLPEDGENASQIDLKETWRDVTYKVSDYTVKSARATHIRNPVLRYLHRIMMYLITARYANRNRVETAEVALIWGMIKNRRIRSDLMILKAMREVDSKSEPLILGGLVTAIADHIGLDLRKRKPIGPVGKLNFEILGKMDIIELRQGVQFWKISPTESLALPNRSYVHLGTKRSIRMKFPQLPQVPEPCDVEWQAGGSARNVPGEQPDREWRADLEDVQRDAAWAREQMEELRQTNQALWIQIQQLTQQWQNQPGRSPGPPPR